MSDTLQISALHLRRRQEIRSSATDALYGLKKALVEQALLHHLQALNELPADLIIPLASSSGSLLRQSHPTCRQTAQADQSHARAEVTPQVTVTVRRLNEPTIDLPFAPAMSSWIALFFSAMPGENQFRHHVGTTYVAIEGPPLSNALRPSRRRRSRYRILASMRRASIFRPIPFPSCALGRLCGRRAPATRQSAWRKSC